MLLMFTHDVACISSLLLCIPKRIFGCMICIHFMNIPWFVCPGSCDGHLGYLLLGALFKKVALIILKHMSLRTYFLSVCRSGIRRRQWHPTPVLLPGKSHGWRSLVGCSPWGCTESDMTERLSSSSSSSRTGIAES